MRCVSEDVVGEIGEGQKGGDASVLKLNRAYFDAKGRGVSEKLFSKNAAAFYRVAISE